MRPADIMEIGGNVLKMWEVSLKETEEDMALAAKRKKIEDEVAVLALGKNIGVETLPACLAGARLQRHGAVRVVNPVTLGLPTGEVLAVEEWGEARGIGGRVRHSGGRRANREGFGGGDESEGQQGGEEQESGHANEVTCGGKRSSHMCARASY